MALYRKMRTYQGFRQATEEDDLSMTVVPRMYGVLLGGIMLLLAVVLGWAFFGSVNDTTVVGGIYHPGTGEPGEVFAFIPITAGKSLEPGMTATVALTGYNVQRTGSMRGKIVEVEEEVTDVEQMRAILEDDLVAGMFVNNGPVVKVVFQLEKDPSSANGYVWTHQAGRDITIHDYTFANMTVVTATRRPITLGMSGLAELFGNK